MSEDSDYRAVDLDDPDPDLIHIGEEPGWLGKIAAALWGLVAFVLLVAFAALVLVSVGYIAKFIRDADPGEIQPTSGDGYLEIIFADRGLVWATRVALMLAAFALMLLAVWVAGSIVVRVRRRHWLKSGFGLEADTAETFQDTAEKLEETLELLDEARREKALVEEMLDDTLSEAQEMTAELAELMHELTELETQTKRLHAKIERLAEDGPDEQDPYPGS